MQHHRNHSPDHRVVSLSQLGQSVTAAASPEQAVLECVPNPHPGDVYLVRFTAPEFTSLCPVTGQPDFAHLVIDYVPDQSLVESKSLKLFLTSFRNHGAFHEDCTLAIAKRCVAAARPAWLRARSQQRANGSRAVKHGKWIAPV